MTQKFHNENRLCIKLISILVTATCFAVPTTAFSQPHTQTTAASVASTQSKQDDRMLDELATKYYAIKFTDDNAVVKLKKLERKVASFRKELTGRSYPAGDVYRDTVKLDTRIRAQLKKWEAREAETKNATVSAAPVSDVTTTPVSAPSQALSSIPIPAAPEPAVTTPAPAPHVR